MKLFVLIVFDSVTLLLCHFNLMKFFPNKNFIQKLIDFKRFWLKELLSREFLE